MALKNILTIASILFAAVSCSMEDDLIDNATKAQSETNESIAYLSINVNAPQAVTKSGESYPDEATRTDRVTSCSLILLDADKKVYRAYDGLAVSAEGKITLSSSANGIQVKLSKGETNKKFYAVVVANTAQTFAACTNYTDVEGKVLDDADMDANVKISGLTEIIVPKGYPTLAEAVLATNIISKEITVNQLTARIELKEINVNFPKTNPVNVQIKGIQLINRNIASLPIVNDETKKSLGNSAAWSVSPLQVYTAPTTGEPDAVHNFNGMTTGKPFFNTFPNFTTTAEKATAIRFTLAYQSADGTNEKTFEFAINRPTQTGFDNNSGHDYIKAGYVYQLVINASLTSTIECTVKCYTMDWMYNKLEYIL